MVHRNTAIRWLVLCLALTMVLTGCSNTNTGSQSPDKPANTSNANTPAQTVTEADAKVELDPVTLKWFILGSKGEETAMVFDHFNERLQEYLPNTTVEFEVVEQSEYAERWELAAAAGEQFDIAWTGYVHDFVDQVNKGAYLPLNDLFDKYGEDMKREIPEWVFDFSMVDGELFAIPSYKDMFDLRAGLRTPKELADKYWDYEKAEKQFFSRVGREWTDADYAILEEYMKKLKDAGELKLGISDTLLSRLNNGTSVAGGHTGPFTIRENDDTFTVQLRFELDAVKRYYDVMADWFKKGYVRPDILSNQNRRQDEGNPNGYTLWFHTSYVNQSEMETSRFQFPIEVIPVEKDWRILPANASSATAIPRTAANPERAMMLINLMNTTKGKELNNIIIYGIEDVHYTKISENRIKQPAPDERKNGAFNIFVPGNQFNAYETDSQMEGYVDYIKDIQENALVSPLVGFKPDISNISTEMAQLTAIIKEYEGLNLGALPNHEASYKEFIDKLHKSGSEQVRVELQKQVDAFLSSKGIPVPSR